MLGTVAGGDVVLGDERHQIGRAREPVNFLGLALVEDRTERELRGKSGFGVQGRILCVLSCRKTPSLSPPGPGGQCGHWTRPMPGVDNSATGKSNKNRLCHLYQEAEPWNRVGTAGTSDR